MYDNQSTPSTNLTLQKHIPSLVQLAWTFLVQFAWPFLVQLAISRASALRKKTERRSDKRSVQQPGAALQPALRRKSKINQVVKVLSEKIKNLTLLELVYPLVLIVI